MMGTRLKYSPLELDGAGIYFARVSSGGETAVSRVVVLD